MGVIISPTEYTAGLCGFLQGRIDALVGTTGGLNLDIRTIEGRRSKRAITGIYRSQKHPLEFQAEFYNRQLKLHFDYELRIPSNSVDIFKEVREQNILEKKDLTRILTDATENHSQNDEFLFYNVTCKIKRDPHQISDTNSVYQDIYEYIIKRSFKIAQQQLKS